MKTIAIMHNKGGTGKTVTAINMADILNKNGSSVILVDCDGQANLTQFFAPHFDECVGITVANVLCGSGEVVWSDNLLPIRPGLDLLPGSSELYDIDLHAVTGGASNVLALRHFCEAAKEDGNTDYIIFDCPPGFTVSSVAALMAADEVIIPMSIDGFSISGVEQMHSQIASLHRANNTTKIAGILITQWRNSDVARESEKLLRSMGIRVFQTVIRRTEKIPESTFMRMPITEHSRLCAASKDYLRFVDEYLGGATRGQI